MVNKIVLSCLLKGGKGVNAVMLVGRLVVRSQTYTGKRQATKLYGSENSLLNPEYKVIVTTYKLLQSSSPRFLHYLITIQLSQSTQSSTSVTLFHHQFTLCHSTNHSFGVLHWEQASSYSSCSLSVRYIIITQLFSVIRL